MEGSDQLESCVKCHRVKCCSVEPSKHQLEGRYILGLEIAKSSKGILLTQRKYTLQLLEDTGYLAYKPQSLPMDPNCKLNSVDGEPLSDVTLYRRLIGRLMYLTISRPDITYAVHKLSQFMSKPRTPHLHVVHHVIQYLKGTPS